MKLNKEYYKQTSEDLSYTTILKNIFNLLDIPVAHTTINNQIRKIESFPNINMGQLIEFIKTLSKNIVDCEAYLAKDISALDGIILPIISSFEENGIAEIIIITDYQNDEVTYIDPSVGYIVKSREEFEKNWNKDLILIKYQMFEKPKLIQPNDFKFEIRTNTKKGKSIYCTEHISKEELIETIPLIEHIRYDDKKFQPVINYLMSDKSRDEENIPSYIMLGYGSIYNHSNNPNATFKIEGDFMYLRAHKDIEPGEEIFINYGDKYWTSRGIAPE